MSSTNTNFQTDKLTSFTPVTNIKGFPIVGVPADGQTISFNAVIRQFEFKPFAPPALLLETTTVKEKI